jgi:hypothetical protein
LKDQTLAELPTDLTGRLYKNFDTQHPDTTIPQQVNQWISDWGLSRKGKNTSEPSSSNFVGEFRTEPVMPPGPQHRSSIPDLRESAKRLLFEASKDRNGHIAFIRTRGGLRVQTNGKQLVASDVAKEAAKWKGAIDELLQHGYVEARGSKGEVFAVTETGFARAEELAANDSILRLSDEAKQILEEATKDAQGIIHLVPVDGGFEIQTNQRPFVPENDPQAAARWKHGFDQLRTADLIESAGDESMFRVTKQGFDVAKELS